MSVETKTVKLDPRSYFGRKELEKLIADGWEIVVTNAPDKWTDWGWKTHYTLRRER